MKPEHRISFIMLATALLATLAIMIASLKVTFFPKESESNTKISYLVSLVRISSSDLNSSWLQWEPFVNKRVVASNQYGYAKIEIDNSEETPFNGYIYNLDINISTLLLECGVLEAITTARFGDQFPDTSGYGFNKAAFHVTVPPQTKKTYILEYESNSLNELFPIVMNEQDFIKSFLQERILLFLMPVLILVFSIYLVISSIVFKKRASLAMALFSLSELFFYLRQTRILLVVPGIAIPSWLHSMQLVTNLATAVFLLASIKKDIRIIHKVILMGVTILSFMLFSMEFFFKQDMYTWINLLSVFFDLYIVIELIIGTCERNYPTILTSCSILPWFTFMLLDTISVITGVRLGVVTDYSPLMSFTVTVIIYSVFTNMIDVSMEKEKRQKVIDYFAASRSITYDDLMKMDSIPADTLAVFFGQLQLPMEKIQASATMLSTPMPLPRIIAISRIIEEQTELIKQVIGSTRKDLYSETTGVSTASSHFSDQLFEEFNDNTIAPGDISICIFGDREVQSNATLMLIVQSAGFYVKISDDEEEILNMVDAGLINMLLVDPATESERVFAICEDIRARKSIFSFPIIMIIDFYANFIVGKSYAAGINDFVVRPFDSAELISRIYSQLRLSSTYEKNRKLADSEKEKRTFLYLVTHNINTPLTLLVNRIDEMKMSVKNSEVPDALTIDDIEQSISEISNIIQNVLISFKLSDGKVMITREVVDVKELFQNINSQLRSKYLAKKQNVIWNIPDTLPDVVCDSFSLYGILTNILNNAIKYTPDRGDITVSAIPAVFSDEQIEQDNQDIPSLVIRVSDSGPGIAEEKLDVLFNRFEDRSTGHSTQAGSVGLGLYVAKELASLNGLQLQYSHNSEGGSIFDLIFNV